MDVRRLQVLLELSRLGSMREVATSMHSTTSSVSQQIAALSREARTPLIERHGRRVRLTPAGRRLADHAVTILAAIDAARLDLDPDSEPVGTIRIGGFATAIRRSLMPVVRELCDTHPRLWLLLREYEPREALGLLENDDLDLVLAYDYNLAPALIPNTLEATKLWTTTWGLAVPAEHSTAVGPSSAVVGTFADHSWIVNSRGTADEEVVRTLANLAGITPRITHAIDNHDLIEDLILAGQGIALLPASRPPRPGVRILPLREPNVLMTAYAVVRVGRSNWPPLRLVLERVSAHTNEKRRPSTANQARSRP